MSKANKSVTEIFEKEFSDMGYEAKPRFKHQLEENAKLKAELHEQYGPDADMKMIENAHSQIKGAL